MIKENHIDQKKIPLMQTYTQHANPDLAPKLHRRSDWI